MKVELKLSDFYYKEPNTLSERCTEELLMVSEAKKDRAELFTAWNEKFKSEVAQRRDAQLMNVSNFAFLLSLLGGAKDDKARIALDTYRMKRGFIHADGKWICNYVKALELIEKTEAPAFRHEHAEPVYGGAYDR
jgi:hypothetical protein